jgi:plastocyanin
MMSRSVICSRALWTLALAGMAGTLLGASVSGRVLLINSHDPEVNKKKDFAGVVVWLKPFNVSMPPVVPKRHVQMVQKDKKFNPHMLVIGAGTSVDFPNMDPIFHNAFSNFEGQIFDIGLYPPGSSRAIQFDRPGIVRVFCNIHPSMSAVIVVVDSPYFTITDPDGNYSFSRVLAGAYSVHFFHERATPETLESLVRTIRIDGAPIEIAGVTVSEAGYLPVAHKNKYGRDYPPNADPQRTYANPPK